MSKRKTHTFNPALGKYLRCAVMFFFCLALGPTYAQVSKESLTTLTPQLVQDVIIAEIQALVPNSQHIDRGIRFVASDGKYIGEQKLKELKINNCRPRGSAARCSVFLTFDVMFSNELENNSTAQSNLPAISFFIAHSRRGVYRIMTSAALNFSYSPSNGWKLNPDARLAPSLLPQEPYASQLSNISREDCIAVGEIAEWKFCKENEGAQTQTVQSGKAEQKDEFRQEGLAVCESTTGLKGARDCECLSAKFAEVRSNSPRWSPDEVFSSIEFDCYSTDKVKNHFEIQCKSGLRQSDPNTDPLCKCSSEKLSSWFMDSIAKKDRATANFNRIMNAFTDSLVQCRSQLGI